MKSKDESSEYYDEDEGEKEEESFEVSPRKHQERIVINVFNCQYDVVREVAKKDFNMIVYEEEDDGKQDWDLMWFDGGIGPQFLKNMLPHQRTNHFAGTYYIARKNHLGKNLIKMRKLFPNDYNFFPPTWMLPTDLKDFKAQFNAKKAKTFIVKPEASSQGKGIFLTRHLEEIDLTEPMVAQRYLHKPYLIDGLKFDLRIYVLLVGIEPLRLYVYNEGLARFATETYQSPTPQNLGNLFMHLTNYSINKEADNF
jgi:tubulin polyglutamylase TTLL6/13